MALSVDDGLDQQLLDDAVSMPALKPEAAIDRFVANKEEELRRLQKEAQLHEKMRQAELLAAATGAAKQSAGRAIR